ncbi:MAG TPA: Rieske (2Fe-2S) protein [Solirubrobacteraceae bacterium]|nr:Rieske (2Fe-2S) protein [Solirubrobacteraceae bacterium]
MADLATDSFRSLGPRSAIPPETVTPFYLDDRKRRVSIAQVDERLFAFDDLCTCAPEPCPLSAGLLSGTTIMCQCHGSRFDVTSGAVIDGPATEGLHTYEVRDVNGTVEIRA